MKLRKSPESDLTQATQKWLRRRGFLVLPEVRVQPHSIDLVAFEPSTLSLSAVEVKVKDWRKALRQSSQNKAFVDLSYVAMPEKLARRILREVGSDARIGVLALRVTTKRVVIKIVREAVRDGRPNRHFRRYVIAKLASHYGERLVQ